MMKKHFLIVAALTTAFYSSAQIKTPAASPTFELKGTVGFADIKVVYARPSAKGREIFGNLIPLNEVWRTGANASTKISFSEQVKLNGHSVSAGDYALYTIFTEETATIILSKNLTWWGTIGYDESEDILRFDVPVKHPSSHYETFTISFSDFTRNSANLNMKWEHTKAMFTIETEVDNKVMADIKAQLIDGNPEKSGDYYNAAAYYYDTKRDSKLALEWIGLAIEKAEKPQYWTHHMKAKILARMGKNKEAIASARKSIEIAADVNPDYVKLNKQLIAGLK